MPLDIYTAALAADLSMVAYQPDIGARAPGGLSVVGRLHNGGDRQRGFVAVSPGAVWVVFRGSRGQDDWKANLEFGPSRLNLLRGAGIRVHGGFEDVVQGTWDSLLRVLDTLPAAPRVVFAGHSQGGALASLAALCAFGSLRLRVAPEVYSFGAPYVGNREFARTYDLVVPDTLRVVHGQDPVPRLDPGYGAHVGRSLKLRADGTRAGAAGGLLDELAVWFHRRFRDVTLLATRDHAVGRYVMATAKAAARRLAL